jgi:HlyD family secretion protein
MRKALIWLLIIGAVIAVVGGYLWYQQRQSALVAPEILRSAELERGVLAIEVNASGTIAMENITNLVIESPGKISDVTVAVGDRVEADETLATLATEDLKRSLHQAEIGLALAELALETAQKPVDPEDVRLAELAVTSAAESLELARLGRQIAQVDANDMIVQAQRNREQAFITLRDASGDRVDRAETAFSEAEGEEKAARINAEVTIAQAESQYQSAYTAYQRALANLASLREGPKPEDIRQQEIQVAQAGLRRDQVQRQLQESRIVAPYSGLIGAVEIEADTYQSVGQTAFIIIDDRAYYVDVVIDEIDISAVSPGQTVAVMLDAYPDQTLSGVVETIAPEPSDLNGLVAYEVRVRIENSANLRILERMTASVTITTNRIEDVLLLPAWAIRVDQQTGEAYTYVVQDGIARRTTVELGRRNEAYSEALEGVRAGDTVALALEERTFTPPGSGEGGPFQ